MKIVCLGDSTTYGYMVERKKVWVSILNDKFGDKISFVNKGINGDTTSGMLSRVEKHIIEENPDFLSLMAGVNDLSMFWDLEKIKDNIKSIVKIVKKAVDTEIILSTPMPFIKEACTFFDFEFEELEKIERTLEEYIDWIIFYSKENNIKCIDVNRIMKDIYSSSKDVYFDGVHLNEKGHSLFAEEFYPKLKEFID